MVRRTKSEAAATREALLDAAERSFRDRGVAHTSLADIAAAAGVTRGAVYWHFRDKSDLFEALCDRVELPMEAMLARAGEARHKDPLGKLRELAVLGLTGLASDPRAQAVLDVMFHKCELASAFASVSGRSHATDSDCLVAVERLMRQAVTAGQLPPDTDARLAARSLTAYIAGIMHQWVRQPGAYDLRRAAPVMIETFMSGLRTHPPLRQGATRIQRSRRPTPARTR